MPNTKIHPQMDVVSCSACVKHENALGVGGLCAQKCVKHENALNVGGFCARHMENMSNTKTHPTTWVRFMLDMCTVYKGTKQETHPTRVVFMLDMCSSV